MLPLICYIACYAADDLPPLPPRYYAYMLLACRCRHAATPLIFSPWLADSDHLTPTFLHLLPPPTSLRYATFTPALRCHYCHDITLCRFVMRCRAAIHGYCVDADATRDAAADADYAMPPLLPRAMLDMLAFDATPALRHVFHAMMLCVMQAARKESYVYAYRRALLSPLIFYAVVICRYARDAELYAILIRDYAQSLR